VGSVSFRSLSGIGEIAPGDDLGAVIALAAGTLDGGEIVAIAQKAVSKAEGAVVELASVTPGTRARELAAQLAAEGSIPTRDPRAVQVVLDQSAEIVRAQRGVLICRTHHGFVCANAGVDASNAMEGTLITLPADPDDSARRIRARFRELTGAAPGVLITDSFGRAWRHGQCDVAIGCAGLAPLEDWRGRSDSAGRELTATWLAVADAIAAAADLARAKDSGEPAVIVEGLERLVSEADGAGATALLRPVEEDLFP
jgi:coenzyme F420-0:L-glutamate ligase/coenzyme F420-1:gamma-L-glutamate ligase